MRLVFKHAITRGVSISLNGCQLGSGNNGAQEAQGAQGAQGAQWD